MKHSRTILAASTNVGLPGKSSVLVAATAHELRNDQSTTRLTKSIEIGSVTYLVVTLTEAGRRTSVCARKRGGDDGRERS